jgi:threonine/homoserine/homoserine lactone efflux protein
MVGAYPWIILALNVAGGIVIAYIVIKMISDK